MLIATSFKKLFVRNMPLGASDLISALIYLSHQDTLFSNCRRIFTNPDIVDFRIRNMLMCNNSRLPYLN